jgi:ubiquinone/menaquinone biosynthesis C-methylase UbiE
MFNIVGCDYCRVSYISPQPSREELQKHYPDDYSVFRDEKNTLIRFASKILYNLEIAFFSKYIKSGRALDVGCGKGDYLTALSRTGRWEVSGLELNSYAAKLAQERLKITIHNSTLEQAAFAKDSFDLVILRHVLEHLPEPSLTLGHIHRILSAKGILYLELPNLDSWEYFVFKEYWNGLDVPRHLFNFTPYSIKLLLEKNGFRILSLRYSFVPNSWIGSIRQVLLDKFKLIAYARAVKNKNIFGALLFMPVSFLSMIMRKSGRMQIVATKS